MRRQLQRRPANDHFYLTMTSLVFDWITGHVFGNTTAYFLNQMRRDQHQPAVAEIRAIYAELAKRPLERACLARTECCQFQLTGLTPHLTKGEALVAAKGFRATGRKELPETTDGTCPLLKPETGRCLDLRRPAVRLPHALLRRRRRTLSAQIGAGFDSPA